MLTTEEKTNITEGFTAAGERITENEENTKSALQELQKQNGVMMQQLKMYGKAFLTGRTETGEGYTRFWPTDEHAKQFGEIVFKALGKKALGEGTNVGGGVLVPEELSVWMIQLMGKYGKYRKNVTVVPVGSDRLTVPKIESDVTIYAPGENIEIPPSEPTFGQVGLNIVKFVSLCAVSNELDEDSMIGIGEILGISISRSMAKKEDLIGFVGDGTSTYFGMTGIVGALRDVDATIGNIKGLVVGTGNAYAELALDDFEDVVSILPDDADDGAKWYVNRKFFFSVMHRLARAAGASDMFSILSDRKERFFMGYPVEFVSAMPSVEADSQICALLGDLQLGAYLGERKGLVIDKSTDVYFKNDQVGIRGKERVAITVFGVGDTAEAGPIVGLITAAT